MVTTAIWARVFWSASSQIAAIRVLACDGSTSAKSLT
jgi:hypothetical protein